MLLLILIQTQLILMHCQCGRLKCARQFYPGDTRFLHRFLPLKEIYMHLYKIHFETSKKQDLTPLFFYVKIADVMDAIKKYAKEN